MSAITRHTLADCFKLRARIGWQGLRSDEFIDFGPYLVTGTDFIYGKIDWDTCYHVNEQRYEQDKGIQLRENDLLVTKDGTVGKTAFVVDCPEKATLNSHIFLVRAINGSVVPAYLYYILNSHIFDVFLQNILTGTTIKGLTQGNFYKFTFDAPDTPRQRRIAEILATVDEAIEKTRALIVKYQSIKTGMMQDLLGTGEEVLLSDCLYVCHGKSQKGVESPDGDYPILGTGGLMGYSRIFLWDKPSVLIGRKGTIDQPQYMDTPFWTIDTLYYTDIFPAHHAKYFFYLFQTIPWRNYNEATGVPSLSSTTIGKIKVRITKSKTTQIKIADQLSAADAKIQTERDYLAKLQDIKRGLMQDLLDPNGVSVDALL